MWIISLFVTLLLAVLSASVGSAWLVGLALNESRDTSDIDESRQVRTESNFESIGA
ncbi:hypothetical protein IB229_10565 [Pseudomonas sp. PDM14]|uniref:hypothetical protein n=1 Tax=Pseudomonas sp. PDM14 TaxID=2769288 RepID=UPI00178520A1|nr:hypothetical protein [Pseudomonas sp. PDM14]MBD9483419.1 hypothetical protein [Pseudomonas sp. PDM14]